MILRILLVTPDARIIDELICRILTRYGPTGFEYGKTSADHIDHPTGQ